MEYETQLLGRDFVVRWKKTPSRAAVEALARDFDTAHTAAGEPIVLFVVIPTDEVDLPPPDARAAFQASIRNIFERCASVETIILGDGIRASLMRTALRAMTIISRRSDRVYIHASADDAIRARQLPAGVAAALRGKRPGN